MHVVLSPDLSESAFQILPAGGSIQASFDIAKTYDLAQGGAFDVVAKGAFSYAELNANAIAGTYPFTSNTVTATVDGTQASQIYGHHALARRAILVAPFTKEQDFKARHALLMCGKLSEHASRQAKSSDPMFKEYWKYVYLKHVLCSYSF